jgi:hypothetical protein
MTNAIKCNGCGGELVFELLVPSEVWEQICNDDYALCPLCIDDRCAALNIRCEVIPIFNGKAVRTSLDNDLKKVVCSWRNNSDEVSKGSVGHPLLYSKP